jgi:hypothetical protein
MPLSRHRKRSQTTPRYRCSQSRVSGCPDFELISLACKYVIQIQLRGEDVHYELVPSRPLVANRFENLKIDWEPHDR